jgi:crotonobetainyl-CoA:carnitine CoA-transferase CaiB-like acyl-CoA transferase
MRSYPELFASINANKRSIVLDLKRDEDRARALELAADADVVVEGFRPGVAARLGMGYDDVCAVAPSIVYCSLSGLGQTGPFRLVPGHDLNYQAWAGALAPEGGRPEVSKLPIADLAGGMAAAFAISSAVVRCQRTGEGEHIDVAMTDVLATWTGAAAPRTSAAESSARGVPGYGLFATAGGAHVTLGVISEDHFWTSLCTVLGLNDVRELEFAERMARVDDLQSRVAAAIASRDRDELVDELLAADVPVAPVLDRTEMLALEHLRERDVATSDPWADPSIGYPVRFERHVAARTSPPPGLDEHHGAGFHERPRP